MFYIYLWEKNTNFINSKLTGKIKKKLFMTQLLVYRIKSVTKLRLLWLRRVELSIEWKCFKSRRKADWIMQYLFFHFFPFQVLKRRENIEIWKKQKGNYEINELAYLNIICSSFWHASVILILSIQFLCNVNCTKHNYMYMYIWWNDDLHVI